MPEDPYAPQVKPVGPAIGFSDERQAAAKIDFQNRFAFEPWAKG
jgi:hypothetical protein